MSSTTSRWGRRRRDSSADEETRPDQQTTYSQPSQSMVLHASELPRASAPQESVISSDGMISGEESEHSASWQKPSTNFEEAPSREEISTQHQSSSQAFKACEVEFPTTPPTTTSPSYTSDFACTWPSCSMTFPRIHERDRHYRTVHANNGERPYKCRFDSCPADVTSWTRAEKLRQHNKVWHGPYNCQITNCPRGFPSGFGSPTELSTHIESIHEGNISSGEPESVHIVSSLETLSFGPGELKTPGLVPVETEVPWKPRDGAESPATGNEFSIKNSQMSDGAGRNPSTTSGSIIRAESPTTRLDKRDSSFRLQKSSKFKFGNVFKLLWSEPKGGAGTDISDSDSPQQRMSFHKVRRFLIVKVNKGHCTCLPILTYGGQGTLKRGVHADDHMVLYSSKEGPILLPGEQLFREALQMQPNTPRDRLDPTSRINLAKVYTVEHNVKVCFIGQLTRWAMEQLVAAYNDVHPPLPYPEPHLGYTLSRKVDVEESAHPYDMMPRWDAPQLFSETSSVFQMPSPVLPSIFADLDLTSDIVHRGLDNAIPTRPHTFAGQVSNHKGRSP